MIIGLLKASGPLLGSEIREGLVGHGYSPEAARKLISRSCKDDGQVIKFDKLNLPHNEGIYYLKEHTEDQDFINSIVQALNKCRSAYGWAIDSFYARGGGMTPEQFMISSGFPSTKFGNRVCASDAMQKLSDAGILKIDYTGDPVYVYAPGAQRSLKYSANDLVEKIVLQEVKELFRKVGAVSFEKVVTRGENPIPVADLMWDFTAPTYAAGMRLKTGAAPKPGFFMIDAILGQHLTLAHIQAFLNKCGIIASQRRQQRFQPMLIADSMESNALQCLKEKGILVGFPPVLFGREAAEALTHLAKVLCNAAAAIKNDPEAVFRTLKDLSKLEGAMFNLRGTVLTLIAAHLFSRQGYMVDVLQPIMTLHGKTDIDVKAVRSPDSIFIECKGMKPGNLVGCGEIETWEGSTIPKIKEWIKGYPSLPANKKFLFLSSTGYTNDAIRLANELKSRHRRQPLEFWDASTLLRELEINKLNSVIKVFKEFFQPRSS